MWRELTAHKINVCNEAIRIEVMDEPGQENACHKYRLSLRRDDGPLPYTEIATLPFQNGPIVQGVNGVTDESLLAVLIDRLEGFQSGRFACQENERALSHLRAALAFLQVRTGERIARGVEGTHTP